MEKERPATLVTLPDSPYRILEVPFDADSKQVTKGMRTLLRKDPKHGAMKGSKAQKQLNDPQTRLVHDAFCQEVISPAASLAGMGEHLGGGDIYCRALADPLLLSDIQFPGKPSAADEIDPDWNRITYQEGIELD